MARDKTEIVGKNKEADRPEGKRKNAASRRLRNLRSLLVRFLLLTVTLYVLFFHLVGITRMPNSDMYPRVDAGDLVLFYRLEKNIKAQDIVVLEKPLSALEMPDDYESYNSPNYAGSMAGGGRQTSFQKLSSGLNRFDHWVKERLGRTYPEEDTEMFICRVVAAAGDTVEINESERLIVNGNTMIEPNIFYSTPEYFGFVEYPVTLQTGEYFVLADNRQGGADSRFFGVVKKEEILGTVITILRRNNL